MPDIWEAPTTRTIAPIIGGQLLLVEIVFFLYFRGKQNSFKRLMQLLLLTWAFVAVRLLVVNDPQFLIIPLMIGIGVGIAGIRLPRVKKEEPFSLLKDLSTIVLALVMLLVLASIVLDIQKLGNNF